MEQHFVAPGENLSPISVSAQVLAQSHQILADEAFGNGQKPGEDRGRQPVHETVD